MKGSLAISPRKLYILILCTLAFICIADAGWVPSKIEGNHVRGRHLLQVASSARDATGRRFCGLNDEGECDWMSYGQSAAYVIVPGIIFTVLSIIAFPVFCIGRFCCNCFGGRRRTPGIFCGTNPEEFKGYNKRSIWIVKILVFVVMAAIALGVLFGYLGNQKMNSGITKLQDTVIGTAEDLIDKGIALGEELARLEFTTEVGSTVITNMDQFNEALDTVKDYRVTVDEYNNYRSIVIIVILILPLILVILGFLGAVLNWKYLALIAGITCFFVSALIWLMYSVHMSIAVVLGDACADLYPFIDAMTETENGTRNEMVDPLFKCLEEGGSIAGVAGIADEALGNSFAESCSALSTICDDPFVYCSRTCSRANIALFKNDFITDYVSGCADSGLIFCPYEGPEPCNTVVPCDQQNITIANCVTDCRNSQLQTSAAVFVQYLDLLLAYEKVVQDHVYPLVDCEWLVDTVNDIESSICEDIAGGIDQVATAMLIIAIFLIPSTVLLIIGFKRFRKSSEKSQKVLPEAEDTPKGETPK